MSHPLPEPHPADPRRTEEFIDGFAELRRLRGAADAQELHLLARAGTVVTDADWTGRASTREIARRSLVAELACAARLSEWTVTRLLIEARDLCERFAPLVAALESGEISRQHVAVIHDAGAAIRDTADLERFTTAALARARETTPGRLGPIVRVLAERYLPVSLDERHAQAVADRSVEVRDLADGMASLMAVLPATLAHGIDDRLTAQARAVLAQSADEGGSADAGASAEGEQLGEGADADPRTLAQARTDVFTDLLLGGTPDRIVAGDAAGAIRATVQVTVPVLTTIGESEEPCLLAGYGPIDSDTARPPLRRRPHRRPRPGRGDLCMQPGSSVQATPHTQGRLRLDGRADLRRGAGVDQPLRPATYRPAGADRQVRAGRRTAPAPPVHQRTLARAARLSPRRTPPTLLNLSPNRGVGLPWAG